MRPLLFLVASAAMLFAPTTDDFSSHHTGSLGTNWTCASGSDYWENPTSNAVNNAAASHNETWCYYATGARTFAADQYSQAKLTHNNDSAQPMVSVRFTGTAWADGTGYLAVLNHTGGGDEEVRVLKYANSENFTVLASGFGGLANGDVIKLSITGTTLSVYDNGSLLGTAVDSTSPYLSGQPGLFSYDPTGGESQANLWQADDSGGGGAVFPKGIPNNPIRCCDGRIWRAVR